MMPRPRFCFMVLAEEASTGWDGEVTDEADEEFAGLRCLDRFIGAVAGKC